MGELSPLGEVAGRVGNRIGPHRSRLAGLGWAWRQAAGATLAERSRVVGSRGATLLVGCDDERWLKAARAAEAALLDKMVAIVGDGRFERVEFVLRPRLAPPRPPRRSAPERRPLEGRELPRRERLERIARRLQQRQAAGSPDTGERR